MYCMATFLIPFDLNYCIFQSILQEINKKSFPVFFRKFVMSKHEWWLTHKNNLSAPPEIGTFLLLLLSQFSSAVPLIHTARMAKECIIENKHLLICCSCRWRCPRIGKLFDCVIKCLLILCILLGFYQFAQKQTFSEKS